MKLIQLFYVAFTALRVNLLRSMLTMLGIIIGVSAVIIMVSLGAGAQEQIERQLENLGGSVFIIFNNSRRSGGASTGAGSVKKLTTVDADYLKSQVPGVEEAAAALRGSGQIVFGNMNWRTNIDGIASGYLAARSWEIADGRSFGSSEWASAAKVAILGETVRAELFGESASVGQVVRINNFNVRIIGIVSPKGQSANGIDLDDRIFMPIETVRKRIQGIRKYNPKAVDWVTVKMLDGYDMTFAKEDIISALRTRMKIRPNQDNNFTVKNLSEMYEARAKTTQIFNSLLTAVASVSLLVGGIGIMNIMLVSVTERTREIGLRMAVGAKSSDILRQFLVEATTLCGLGGAIGILLAGAVVTILEGYTEYTAVIEYHIVLISLAFSALIGVFFGYYPALKASRLQPIDALRHE
jgi:putative ABC transport system permease protein